MSEVQHGAADGFLTVRHPTSDIRHHPGGAYPAARNHCAPGFTNPPAKFCTLVSM